MLLHTVNKPPEQSPALHLCLRFATQDDAVLLIEDGVLAALVAHPACATLLTAGPRVLALRPDLEQRGVVHKLHPAIEAIDFSGFVALSCACDKVQSWA